MQRVWKKNCEARSGNTRFFLGFHGFCGCFGYERNMFFLKGPGNEEILLGFVMTQE